MTAGIPTTAGSPQAAAPALVLTLDLGRRYTLRLLNVGLACCAVEFVAASVGTTGMRAPEPADQTGDVEVLVISGTVTDKIAPAVRQLYDALPEPRAVISFGACANSGGPYWDSYCVTKGVDQILPVDLYVPGCPPRPEALVEAVRRLPLGAASGRRDPAGHPDAATSLRAPLVRPAGSELGPADLRHPLPPGGPA